MSLQPILTSQLLVGRSSTPLTSSTATSEDALTVSVTTLLRMKRVVVTFALIAGSKVSPSPEAPSAMRTLARTTSSGSSLAVRISPAVPGIFTLPIASRLSPLFAMVNKPFASCFSV